MNAKHQSQTVVDPDVVFLRIRKMGLTQEQLAKRLNREQTSISKALKGERKTLLARIARHLDYLERKRGARVPQDSAPATTLQA